MVGAIEFIDVFIKKSVEEHAQNCSIICIPYSRQHWIDVTKWFVTAVVILFFSNAKLFCQIPSVGLLVNNSSSLDPSEHLLKGWADSLGVVLVPIEAQDVASRIKKLSDYAVLFCVSETEPTGWILGLPFEQVKTEIQKGKHLFFCAGGSFIPATLGLGAAEWNSFYQAADILSTFIEPIPPIHPLLQNIPVFSTPPQNVPPNYNALVLEDGCKSYNYFGFNASTNSIVEIKFLAANYIMICHSPPINNNSFEHGRNSQFSLPYIYPLWYPEFSYGSGCGSLVYFNTDNLSTTNWFGPIFFKFLYNCFRYYSKAPKAKIIASTYRAICPGGEVRLSVSTTNGKSPYWYSWSPNQWISDALSYNPIVYPDSTTRYIVTVTDAKGCAGTDSITIKVNQQPKASAGKDTSICNGVSVLIGHIATSGKEPYIYSWSPSTGLSATDIASPIATPTQTTKYFVTVTDSNSCQGRDSVVVTVNPLPSHKILAQGATTFCEGSSVVLDAGNGYTRYLWSTGDSTQTVTALTSGTYHVTVANESNCEASDSIIVTVISKPLSTITANGPLTFCNGSNVTLSAPGGLASYRWSKVADSLWQYDTTQSIMVSTEGIYRVEVTNATGCDASDSVKVIVNDYPKPTINASGPTTFCEGDSVVLDAGAGYTTYQWNTGATTQSVVARVSGNYIVTVNDSIGCSGNDTIRVTVIPRPKPTIVLDGSPTPCVGDSVILRVKEDFKTYRWFDGSTQRSVTVFTTNTYYVAVEDINGCWGGISTTVVFTARPKPVITGASSVCENSIATYQVSSRSGSSYNWSIEDSLGAIIAGQGTNSITVRWNASGTTALSVTERSSSGCSGDTSFVVRVGKTLMPRIIAEGPVTFCEGDSVVLHAGIGYASYNWSNGIIEERNIISQSGTYFVTVTDANGCSGSDTIVVTVNPKPTPAVQGQTTACLNTSAKYEVTINSDRTYQWIATGGSIINGQNTNSITVQWNQQGTGTVEVTETVASTQCSASSKIQVIVGSSLKPTIATDKTTFCEGDSATLDAGAGYTTYQWNTGAITQSVVARVSGSYFVSVTDSNGCSGTSKSIVITVNKPPQPTITANGSLAFCEGDSVTLNAGNGFTKYLWNDGATTQSIVVRSNGNYFVTITDTNGCQGTSQTIKVTVFPLPQPIIMQNGSMLSTSITYSSYQWYLNGNVLSGMSSHTIPITQAGMYSVGVTDSNGCSAISQPYEVKQTLRASSTIELPILQASPGDHVIIPLRLASSQYLNAVGAKSFTTSISFNRSVLYPINQTPMGILQDSNRVVSINGYRSDSVGVLTNLEFIAVLGEVERTPLHFEFFTWDTSSVDVQLIDGEFQLNICRAGGPRLIRYLGVSSLQQNRPNPYNTETTIEYTVAEYGLSRLFILDALGRQIATLAEEYEPTNKRVIFNSSQLPSGLYHYILQTPTQMLHRVMYVVK